MKSRRKNLLKFANKINCDTLVAFEPENLFYMTGFWGEGIGILKKNCMMIITPDLEAQRAMEESVDCVVKSSQRGVGLISTLISEIKKNNVCTDCQNFSIMQSLKNTVKTIIQSTETFYKSREIKDSKEITILKKSSKIIDNMFDLCTKTIKKEQRESELQTILMSYANENDMFDTGYRSTLNPLIIASGPNGALPHAQVTKRRFVPGDLIVVDLTLRFKGYVSDATRTFGLGKISEEAKNVYQIVKVAQELGIKAVKPGVSCKKIDDICRDFINEKNYGKYFIHSIGHGIGLEVHELPNISQGSTTKLKKNMAITVEPGVYIPKKFGIRIEDSLLVKDKAVLLHKFTKNLINI